jgi:hypothetical protein
MEVDKDAFSSGQVGSKIWLCEELERTGWASKTTHIYGGWYGMTAFLLLSRGKFKVDNIRSYDVDPQCEVIADLVNQNWVYRNWIFKAFTQDCNQVVEGERDLVINTSTEHFESMDWFNNIPNGTRIIIQGNDMPHDDHYVHSASLDDFIKHYPLSEYKFTGTKRFQYETWGFTRYMVIGIK